jgi:hypothetical protein
MAICYAVVRRAAKAIHGVVFGLTTMGIRNVFICDITLAIDIGVFCHATLVIFGVVVCCAAMLLNGVIGHCATTAISSVVIGNAAMKIGGIVFSLTAMGIPGVVFCHATLVIGIIVCRATLAIHNNQPIEGCVAKMPVTEAKQQATTSRRDKRKRGQCNTNASKMTATRRWW